MHQLVTRLAAPLAAPHSTALLLESLRDIACEDGNVLVLVLAGYLQGRPAHDARFLDVIASRGGMEAVQVLIDYIQRDTEGSDALRYLARIDPGSSYVVATRLADLLTDNSTQLPLKRALLPVAARNGHRILVPIAADLVQIGQLHDEGLSLEAQRTLADMGGPVAVRHLADQVLWVGRLGDAAAARLRNVRVTDASTRMALRQSLLDLFSQELPAERAAHLMAAAGNVPHFEICNILTSAVDGADLAAPARAAAIKALGHMGELARGSVSTLRRLYETGDLDTRAAVAQALAQIGGGEAARALDGWMRGRDPDLTRTLLVELQHARRRVLVP